jgi:hypothetical protein
MLGSTFKNLPFDAWIPSLQAFSPAVLTYMKLKLGRKNQQGEENPL